MIKISKNRFPIINPVGCLEGFKDLVVYKLESYYSPPPGLV